MMVWIKRCPGILVKLRIEIATKLYYLLEARSIKFLQIHSDYPDRIVVQDYSSRYTRNNNSLCDEVIGASSSTFACQIHDVFRVSLIRARYIRQDIMDHRSEGRFGYYFSRSTEMTSAVPFTFYTCFHKA